MPRADIAGLRRASQARDAHRPTGVARQREHLARVDDSVMPMRIKAGANYQNSRFGTMKHAAMVMTRHLPDHGRKGFGGGLPVSPWCATHAHHSSCNCIHSRERDALNAAGACRGRFDLRVQEREIDRSELYIVDEAFFCRQQKRNMPCAFGRPVPVGDGRVGPITRRLWDAYQTVIRGRNNTRAGG